MMRNKYSASCCNCSKWVKAQEGWLLGKNDWGKWDIHCDPCHVAATEAAERVEPPPKEPPKADRPPWEEPGYYDKLYAELFGDQVRSIFEPRKPRPAWEPQWLILEPLRVLGLEPPTTIEKLKTAYRLKALKTHPDRGGSAEDFIAVQEAYETALKFVGSEAVA